MIIFISPIEGDEGGCQDIQTVEDSALHAIGSQQSKGQDSAMEEKEGPDMLCPSPNQPGEKGDRKQAQTVEGSLRVCLIQKDDKNAIGHKKALYQAQHLTYE
jgi:hypothetical protein